MQTSIRSVPRLLTGREVLDLLRLNSRNGGACTLMRLRQKGLPSVRVGASFKYPEAGVAKWIRQHVG